MDLSVRLFNQVGLGDRANKNRLIEKYVRRTEDDFFCTIQIKVIYSDNLFSVLESLLGHTSRPHEIARLAFAESFFTNLNKICRIEGMQILFANFVAINLLIHVQRFIFNVF